MSDVRQKAKDLLRLGLDERTPENEQNAAKLQLLKLIEKYDLLSAGGEPINVPASTLQKFLEKIASMDVEDVANRAERFASGMERIMAASKRVADHVDRVTGPRKRRFR